MSKLFFDHLLKLEKIEKEINKVAKTREEKEELWALVDEIIHHKAVGCILEKLPHESHHEFLGIFEHSAHDERVIFEYLKKKVGENIEEILEQELGKLTYELLETIGSSKKPQV
jgi:biopolymer transport protein ExbB/TolQ